MAASARCRPRWPPLIERPIVDRPPRSPASMRARITRVVRSCRCRDLSSGRVEIGRGESRAARPAMIAATSAARPHRACAAFGRRQRRQPVPATGAGAGAGGKPRTARQASMKTPMSALSSCGRSARTLGVVEVPPAQLQEVARCLRAGKPLRHHARGIAEHHRIGRHVVDHDRPGPDHGAVADRDTREDGGVGRDPSTSEPTTTSPRDRGRSLGPRYHRVMCAEREGRDEFGAVRSAQDEGRAPAARLQNFPTDQAAAGVEVPDLRRPDGVVADLEAVTA